MDRWKILAWDWVLRTVLFQAAVTLPEDNKEDLCDCDLFKLICFMSKVFLILFNKFISITTFLSASQVSLPIENVFFPIGE